ncbi:ATP-binding cassette domain-containing protein [Bacillus sp. 1P06AnD]|uniref:ATP-binding cassette domain-containing protein n=1 Tax=Bacillus sp. 1P06AnD TaxID=3132208 RepID=UPI0039A33F65
MTSALNIQNVQKTLGEFSLTDISFTLPQGYIMGLIGANGAGKSTTLKMIINLIKPDSGDILVYGDSVLEKTVETKQKIGFVFDESHFYEHLNIDTMKKIIAPFYDEWDEEAFNMYINRFKLPTKQKIKTFSKGMKMQLNITLALSHHAKLIIMDEPTAGLDPIIRRDVLHVLQEVVSTEDVSVLFSTHVTTDLENIADYITYIKDGRILFSDEKHKLESAYVLVKGDDKLLDAEARNLFVGLEKNPYGFVGLSDQAEEARFYFGSEVIFETPSLEDIMYYTTKGKIYT